MTNNKDEMLMTATQLDSLSSNRKSYVEWRAKVDFKPTFVSFGQKRFKGFRDKIEFEEKRYIVSNDKNIFIMGIDKVTG